MDHVCNLRILLELEFSPDEKFGYIVRKKTRRGNAMRIMDSLMWISSHLDNFTLSLSLSLPRMKSGMLRRHIPRRGEETIFDVALRPRAAAVPPTPGQGRPLISSWLRSKSVRTTGQTMLPQKSSFLTLESPSLFQT